MYILAKTTIVRLLKFEFIRFSVVGGLGFVINLVILTLLHNVAGMQVFIAQLIAAEIALFSNFILHHHWTYKSHKVQKTIRTLIVQFHAVTWPAIVGSSIMVGVGESVFQLRTVYALVVTSVIAMFWNFVWSKYIVWHHEGNTEQLKEIAS